MDQRMRAVAITAMLTVMLFVAGAAVLLVVRRGTEVRALHNAVGRCDVQAVQQYLDKGGNVNAIADSQGDTLLHYALMGGANASTTRVVRLLVDRGADIKVGNRAGMNPLHMAVYMGDNEAVRLLLLSGADVNARAKDGRRPIDIARQMRRGDTVALLRSKGAR